MSIFRRRRLLSKVSIAQRLKSLAIIEVVICSLLFLFLAINRPYTAYRDYQQDTTQTAALFSTVTTGYIEDALDASKYAGQLLNNAMEQTFIAEALEKGRIQNNYHFCRTLYSHVKGLVEQQKHLSNVAVFELDGSAAYVSRRGSSYYLTKSASDAPWLQRVHQARGGAVIFTPEQREEVGLPRLFEDELVVARSVFNPLKLRSQGAYVLSIDVEQFEQTFAAFRVIPQQEYALFYEGKRLLGGFDAPVPNAAELPLRETSVAWRWQDKTLWVYSTYRFDHNSALVIRAPLLTVITAVVKINGVLLAALLLLLLIFVLVIWGLINGIHRPLQQLTTALDAMTDTFFPAIAEEELPTDLEPLFHAYNRMLSRIDLLINEGLRKDVQRRELELQLLRTQINPHYLYNTLECIHMRAYVNHDFEVARMAELLGANLQYGLRQTNAKVPLHTEFEKAGEYMTLVGYHYGDRVRLVCHLDESIRDCLVVKLLLQPLIENAIQHGLTPERPLTIEVLGYPTNENNLCLQVSDDGEGMTAEARDALVNQLEDEVGEGAIGLRNVHRRLRLRYGAAYGVQIHSIPNETTVVTLTLPQEYGVEET